eukprot:TRINITY_DN11866_c0_g1_i1.p1 TRINITY_DN11866_c0_g1~~TRINITY_DN11866_c0_g1_i1.p1  ORF type:complete len:270 (-),score=67.78 TRINITY_DN11866_c0_g1_i1:146-955(-)
MDFVRKYDSNTLVGGLNDLSEDVLGFRLFDAISMYGSTNHYPILLLTTLTYLGVINGLQYYIKKNSIDLRKNRFVNNYAFVHNVFMAVFSLYMFVDAAVKIYDAGGLESWSQYYRIGNPSSFYAVCDLFYWSKYLELIDTLILVIKKKELGFLHVFHHCTTASVSYATRMQPLWFGVWTNALIHVFMYSHFARPVAFIRSTITSAQIVQFLFVLSTYNWWYAFYSVGVPTTEIVWGNFCYGVYLLFFVKFFIDNYVRPKHKTEARKKQQ